MVLITYYLCFGGIYEMGWVGGTTLFLVAALWLLIIMAMVQFWPYIRLAVFMSHRARFEPGHQVQAHDTAAIRGAGESPDALWRAANAAGGWRTANTASALAGYATRSAEYGQ